MTLRAENIVHTFEGPKGPVRVLDGITLSVASGEVLAVRGPSGSGKTTLLLILGTLLRPTSGQVRLHGQDPYRLSPERRTCLRAKQIGFVFQQYHLIPYLDVMGNVLAPTLATPGRDAPDRARQLVSRLRLTERARHAPADLSTGERQRTALARALLNKPGLLLADEPTSNLDEENAEIVLNCIAEFARDGGAVLLVTHETRALPYATRTVRLENGRFC